MDDGCAYMRSYSGSGTPRREVDIHVACPPPHPRPRGGEAFTLHAPAQGGGGGDGACLPGQRGKVGGGGVGRGIMHVRRQKKATSVIDFECGNCLGYVVKFHSATMLQWGFAGMIQRRCSNITQIQHILISTSYKGGGGIP